MYEANGAIGPTHPDERLRLESAAFPEQYPSAAAVPDQSLPPPGAGRPSLVSTAGRPQRSLSPPGPDYLCRRRNKPATADESPRDRPRRHSAVTRSRNRMLVAAAQLPLLGSQPRRRDPSRPPKALAAILRSRVIACLRAQDAETAMQAAHAAVCGGVSVLEIVMSTPGVLEVVEDLRRSYPSLTFGVGTVLNADDARKAIRAGAQFLMSPGTVMEILYDLDESEVLYIPGVLTPTEVISACNAGAKVVKVYPVSVMGGEMYMSALKKPFPLVAMVASQGITIGSIKSYMEAGASAVVLSDAIFDKELMRERDFIGISTLANRATLEALRCGE